MKKSLFLFFAIILFSFLSKGQTKPSTTTTAKPKTTTIVKKAPVKTTTTKTTTTKTTTVAKPTTTTTTTTVPKPTESKQVTAPVEVIKEPSGPPVTGPLNEGPKSYSTQGQNTNTKTKTNTTTTKTIAAKPDKQIKNNSSNGKQSYIGVRGGYNLSTLQEIDKLIADISTGAKSEYLPGLMGGLVLNFGLSKSLSIQPEILYSQQGFKIAENDEYIKGKLDVVNVPLLLKLKMGGSNLKFFINAGPYIGYKLKQASEITVAGEVVKSDIDFIKEYDTEGIKDNMFDFGAIGGAGIQIKLGGPVIEIEGRYQYGFADAQLYKNGIPADVGKTGRQQLITGTIGIMFPFGGR